MLTDYYKHYKLYQYQTYSLILCPYCNKFSGYTDNAEQEQVKIDASRQLLYAKNDTIADKTQPEPGTKTG